MAVAASSVTLYLGLTSPALWDIGDIAGPIHTKSPDTPVFSFASDARVPKSVGTDHANRASL